MTGTNYTGRCIRPMLKPLSFESEQITKELEMDMTPTKFKEGDCLSDEIDLLTVLDSTGRNNSYSRMFISSTPAGTCAKPTTPKSKRSVLNVLDQLCSPISMETSEEWHLESSIKEKVMLCSTNDTSLLSKSVLNEHKNTMNSNSLDKSLEDNDKDNLSVTHNHLFDDISDTSLQLICEATNNVVDNPKSISNNRKNISNYEVTMSTGDYKSPEGENASVLSNVNSSLKMTSNFEDAKTGSIYPDTFHNRKLIYSNQNFISGVQSLVNLSDLFSEVKCLEEANRIFKKDFKTGDLQFLKGQETPILGISKPKENVQPLKNIVSIQTSSEFEDKSKSLNDSLGITDTQFCEAIEAAELISNLDTSCNVNTYSTKHKSQSGGSLKLYSSSLKKTEKLSSDEIHSTEFITGFEDFHSSNSTCFEIAQKLVVSSPDCEQSLSNTKNLFLPTDKTPEIIHIQNIKPIIEYDKIKIGSKNLDDTSFIHSKKDLIQNNDVEESTKIEFHTSHEFEPILKGFQPAKGKYLKISEDSLKNESLKLIHKEFIVPREKLFQKSDVSIEKDNIEPTIRQNKFDTTCQKSIKLKETRETTKHLPIGRSKVNHKGFLTESDKSSESLDKTRKVFDNELHLSYKGFQTASGKTVEISEKSLKHAKQLFSEEPNLIQSKEEVMNSFEQINQILDGQPSLKCKGFSTTSVNSIKVSDVTLEKAKKLLDDVPNFIQEFLPTENEKSHEFSVDSSKNSKQSFDSQLCIIESRKSVQISADSIERGQKLFDNERIISHKGFQTASGKTVKISEKSLNHAKQLFSEEPNLIQSYQQKLQKEQALNSFEQIEQLLDGHQNIKSKGFSTSSVKSIKVSDESLEKAKKLLDDVPIHEFFPTVNEKSLEFSVESSKNNRESFGSQLCTIESGKSEQISADSFERGRNLLGNERIISHKGFQTASGKTVEISEKSLKQAEQLFYEEPNSLQRDQQKIHQKLDEETKKSLGQVSPQFKVQPSLKYKGFLTASGKLVQISEESLKIANKLLDDESKDNRKSIDVSDKSFKQPKKMCDELSNIVQKGFQTAKEKRVKISEDSLAKAKQFFDDEFYSVQNSYQIINQKSLNIPEKPSEQARLVLNGKLNLIPNGLLTENQKLVKISDRSMNKANELFDDEQKIVQRDFESLTEKTVKDSEKLLEHKGFITASGKSVEILDESLEGARRYLVDESNTMQHVFQTANQNSKVTCRGLRPVHAESVKTPEEILKKTETLMKNIAYEPDAPLQGYRIDGNLSEFTYECSKSTKNYFSANYETSLFPKGFQTASGKSVKICEEALKKAKSLLDFTGLESTPSQTLTDFKISNQSTERVSSNEKRLLNESYEAEYVLKGFTKFHTERNISEKPTKKSVIVQDHSGSKTKVAFQTASGKNVHISEETLRKTKDLFNDDFNENEPTEFKKSINKSSELNQHETKYMKTNMYTLNNLSSTNQFVSSQSFEKSRLDKTKSNISTHIIENNDTEHNDSANLKKYDLHRKTDYYYKEQKRKRDHSVLEESTFDKLKLNEPSLKNLDKTNSHVRRKRRKLFIETDQINDHRLVCDEGGSFKPIGTSVISEADLSLLNQSRINHSGNENLIKENCTPFKMSPSTAREISESMAALLEDEASNSPFSLKPYVSSPSMINDRHVGLPSINCFENEIHFNNKPLSPILGSHSLFKNKSIGGISTPGKLASNIDKTQSSGFKPPYSTSTPNESQLQSKRKLLFSNLYSNAEKRQKTDQSSENVTTMDVVTLRLEAALKQEQYVKEKLKGKEKPCQGSYLLRKQTEKSLILRDLINGPLRMYSTHQLNQYGVKKSVQDISIRNVSYFKFAISDYYSKEIVSSNINGIPIGDGALLILDGEGKAGVKEIARAFLASPSVDPSLISAEWIENHFKWIVLKMSAMEKMFPRELGGRYLTPNSLMLQLKYRYDREIDRNQRPALRKILERDETAAKTMVLYVADIFHAENQSDNEKQMGRQEIELSDSWYSVKASIDYEMEALIRSKKVKVGTKLMITGADLINNDAGCHPLETPANVRLRISTNSCRRARWYTRLGFHSKSPWPTRLNTVLGRGGALPALTAFVARTYPILFLEKVNGRTVIRGVRAEQAAADEHQTKRQQCAETIYAKLQQDLDKSKSTNKNPNIRTAVKTATNTKQLYSLLDGVEDISFLQDILTKEQINEIRQLKEEETKKTQQQLQDRLVEELNKKVPPRNVTRMLKVRLVDEDDSCSALLTIWNPSDDIVSCVSEGNCLTFFNISASGFSRFGDLQLTAGKQTKYSLQKHCSIARRITALSELQNSEFKPQFSEVDVVGLVVQSSEFDKSSSLVYLADSSNNLLGISFWTDLKTTGYANTLTPGALVAVSNLHWRSNVVSWKLPSAYVTEMSTFSQHPRQSHLQEALAQLRLQLQAKDLAKYLENCQERIQSLVAQRNSGGLQLDSTPLGRTTEPTCLVGCSGNGNDKLFRDTNLSVNGSTDTPTIRRLEMLERYGEPPPITVLPASTPTSVKRSFRPPLRKLTDK